MAKFTETWSKGRQGGTVISDTPNREITAREVAKYENDARDFYGGHLIAESIPKKEYVDLISAAPDLLQACKTLARIIRDEFSSDGESWEQIKQYQNEVDKALTAIFKAEGKEVKSNG